MFGQHVIFANQIPHVRPQNYWQKVSWTCPKPDRKWVILIYVCDFAIFSVIYRPCIVPHSSYRTDPVHFTFCLYILKTNVCLNSQKYSAFSVENSFLESCIKSDICPREDIGVIPRSCFSYSFSLDQMKMQILIFKSFYPKTGMVVNCETSLFHRVWLRLCGKLSGSL